MGAPEVQANLELHVVQDDIKILVILPPLSKYWDYKCVAPPYWVYSVLKTKSGLYS